MQPGYERLCCLRCMQPRDHNFATTCVCRVPKQLREEKVIECVHCGCKGCASGDWLDNNSCIGVSGGFLSTNFVKPFFIFCCPKLRWDTISPFVLLSTTWVLCIRYIIYMSSSESDLVLCLFFFVSLTWCNLINGLRRILLLFFRSKLFLWERTQSEAYSVNLFENLIFKSSRLQYLQKSNSPIPFFILISSSQKSGALTLPFFKYVLKKYQRWL